MRVEDVMREIKIETVEYRKVEKGPLKVVVVREQCGDIPEH